jgi:tetratricopeptide (TPR) repeat protein
MQDLTNTLRLIELRRERVEAVLFAAGFPAPAGLKREMDAMHRATARVFRGLVLHSMMNPAYAAEYRAALALVPDYPGLSMPRQDRMPGFAAAGEGGQAFRRHMERARRYMAAGRFGEAAVELGGAVRLEPGSGEAHTHLGEAYLKMGRFDEAEESLNTAIRLSPDRFDAYYHLGWIRLRRRDLKGAVSNFEKGISLNPGVAELHYVLGRAYALENRLGEAGECFRNAIRLSPFDPEFHFEAGMIHERRGRYSDAGRCYEKALELNPEHQPAQQRLRYVRSRPIN